VAWWDNIWRELQNFAERLGGQGQLEPDEIPEETDEEPGGFFGGEEPPEEPPGPADYEDRDYFAYQAGEGPYPDDWGDAEIRFWDRQFDEIFFYSRDDFDRAQELFYDGFMRDDIDSVDRVQAREDFYELTTFDAIDWDAFADYYSETH
jgi:hypothetical protein